MELFSVSDQWTEAFGKTLIHSIWIGLILAALLKLVLYTISHRQSQLRYILSLSTLLLYTGSVIALFTWLYRLPGAVTDTIYPSSEFTPALWMMNLRNPGGPSFHNSIWSFCCSLYALGILIMIIRVAYASFYLHFMRVSGTPAQEPWSTHFTELARKLGIKRDIRLLISEKISVPGLIGWIRPVIIVPAGMLTQLPMNQLETILMHELYHLKRYDFLVNAVQLLLEGIFFYNPAVWLISNSIRVEREHCCDDLVVGSCQTPLLYARALFELSSKDHSFGNLMTAAGGPNASGLSNRIIRILKQKAMKTDIRDKILSLTVFVVGVSIFLIINGFSTGVSDTKPTGTEPGLTIGPVLYPDIVEANPAPEPMVTESAPDTVPVPSEIENEGREELTDEEIDRIIDEAQDAAQKAMEEIDWEEIRESMEEARKEAMEEIDWEEIRESMEEARKETMEEIDWEEIRESMEEARKEALEEINWEEIRQEIEESMNEMEEIDWDAMKQEIENSMNELKEIDWEQMRLDIDKSMKEIDWEQMRKDIEESMKNIDIESFRIDIENSLDDIDWGGIKMDLKQFRIELDSMKQDFVWNPDHS